MATFKVGDRVQCIDDSFAGALAQAKVYTVRAVTSGDLLALEGKPGGWWAWRFVAATAQSDHVDALLNAFSE